MKKLSEQIIKQRYNEIGLELLESYVNQRFKHLTKCLRCENIWRIRPANVFAGQGCNGVCFKQKRILPHLKQDYVEKIYLSKGLQLKDIFKGTAKKHVTECLKCNHTWYAVPRDVLNKSGCPNCAYLKKFGNTNPNWKGGNTEEGRKKRNTDFIRELKDVSCLDCGIKYPYYVMQFDHVRGEKKCDVSGMKSAMYSIGTIVEEVEKCDIVCANCHAERTNKRGYKNQYGKFDIR